MFDQVLRAFGITDPETVQQFSMLQSSPQSQTGGPPMQQPMLPQLPPNTVSQFPSFPQQPQFPGGSPQFPGMPPQMGQPQGGQFNVDPEVLQMILMHMQGVVPQPQQPGMM